MSAKILLLDIETAPALVHAWGLWDQNIGLNQIIEPGYTLCFAAKWLGDRVVNFASVHEGSSQTMVEKIHAMVDEADVVISYNGDRFDLPILNREFIKHGLKPPSPYKKVDLLKVAKRQFKFTSNKLDYVSQFLGLGKKAPTKGHQLWIDCMNGDSKAWAMMERYNKQDVHLLESLYQKLLPWITNHPNMGLFTELERPTCPNCGSHHVQLRGKVQTKTGVFSRVCCNKCGTWSRTRFTEVTKEQRGNILINA